MLTFAFAVAMDFQVSSQTLFANRRPFLDLPPEVRNAIYEAVAQSYKGVWIFQPDTPLAPDTAGPLCLLATCKRVRDEFYDLLLWNTRQRLSPKLSQLPSSLIDHTQHIRNLELMWSRHDHWKCLMTLSNWPSITRLRIVVGENTSPWLLNKLHTLLAHAFAQLEHVDVSNPWLGYDDTDGKDPFRDTSRDWTELRGADVTVAVWIRIADFEDSVVKLLDANAVRKRRGVPSISVTGTCRSAE